MALQAREEGSQEVRVKVRLPKEFPWIRLLIRGSTRSLESSLIALNRSKLRLQHVIKGSYAVLQTSLIPVNPMISLTSKESDYGHFLRVFADSLTLPRKLFRIPVRTS